MYIFGDLPSDLDKQGSPMIPPPPWFGPGITWDIPVKAVPSGLGSQPAKPLLPTVLGILAVIVGCSLVLRPKR